MNQFDSALEYLHDSLLQLRTQGKENLTASKQSLAELIAAKPPTAAASEGPIDNPSAPAGSVSRETQSSSKAERMETLRATALACQKCTHLAASRTQVVFGIGNLDSELLFVGEAPGAEEEVLGEPFVGKSGQLLTKIITAMGFSREEIYLCNVLKCRPDLPEEETGDRKPRPDEMATCLPYLIQQIQIIQPKVIVALGATAMQGMTGAKEPMSQLRGRWHEFQQIPLMATYHPSYLLHKPSNSEKRKVWEDMLQVLERLGKPISEKQRNFFR